MSTTAERLRDPELEAARARQISPEDRDAARSRVAEAFALLGLVDGGVPVCPACGARRKSQVAVRPEKGYWSCRKCGTWGSAIDLLIDHGGYRYPDAVDTLLGRSPRRRGGNGRGTDPAAAVAVVKTVDSFTAEVDSEVYEAVLDAGSFADAARYYADRGIGSRSVRAAGCRALPARRDAVDALRRDLLGRFGRDRLVAAGVISPPQGDRTSDYWTVVDGRYRVLEPHHSPDGRVTALQARPDGRTLERVRAHKRYKQEKDAYEARGETHPGPKVPYQPPFMSLRGGGPKHLRGAFLPAVASAPSGSTVTVVEGVADAMAAHHLGRLPYAIPGTGVWPDEETAALLARHRVAVALDGDDAGRRARDELVDHLAANGVDAYPVDMPDGKDWCDLLADGDPPPPLR